MAIISEQDCRFEETSSRGHRGSTRREPDPADPLTVQARYIGPVKTIPLRQAILDFAAGRADPARRVCLDLLEHAPEHAGAMHLLGLIAHHEGRHAEAMNLLRRAAESPDATALYLLSYAELYCKNIDRRAAMAATRRAVALDESSVLGWFCMGNLLLEAREFEESRRCFEQAVLLDAAFWQARANLALVRARLGEPDEGIAEFERLQREQPGNAELHDNYAALLQELGRYEEALGQAQSAMRDRPDTLEPYLRIADIELQRGRHHAALARLADIEARWPLDPRLLTLKAHLLRHLDQSEAAVALCRNALDRGIESAELLRAYGLALHLCGQEALALEVFDRAAAQSATPDAAGQALSDKAALLGELGRTAEADAVFGLALQQAPALADAWYNRANGKSHRAQDPDIEAMETLLRAHMPYRDRLLLHFALGKAHFDAENIDSAFLHWHEGNRMQRASIDYDPAAASLQMAAIAALPFAFETASSATASRLSELPVFIVGMPRSGSTLVEQMLASHPEIHGGGERLQLRALFDAALPLAADAAAVEEENRLADAALARLRRASSWAQRVIDKDLANFLHLGIIHRVFPRARIIHCRRDPLETCFSAYTKLFFGSLGFAYQLHELGRYYRDYHALMAHWRSVLPQQAFLEIDYETLVSEPQAETRRLLDFLGLAWNDDCLRFFESRRTVSTSSFAQVRQPIYRSSLQRARPLQSHLQPLIAALGELAVHPSRAQD